MKVLVIGGTGLISTEIVKQLVARGDEVVLYNRGERAPDPAGTTSIRGDRRDYPRFVEQVREAGPFDAIIDMITFSAEDAESLVAASRGLCRRLIFCSTVDVYSRPATRYPYTEAEPYGPLSGYAEGKVQCEKILFAAHERGDFELVVIRPAHTYSDGGSAVHTLGWSAAFLGRLRKGLPVIIHGDGQSLWSSCHAWDVAGAFVASLERPVAGKSYHTSGFEWLSWNEYTRQAAEAVGGPPPQIVHIPTDVLVAWKADCSDVVKANFQYSNIFDNSAAVRDLGFTQTITWKEGVARMAAHWDERGGFPSSGPDSPEEVILARWRSLLG